MLLLLLGLSLRFSLALSQFLFEFEVLPARARRFLQLTAIDQLCEEAAKRKIIKIRFATQLLLLMILTSLES